MIALLDGNVLIALLSPDHVHHPVAYAWFAAHQGQFATCPITQGTLLRAMLRDRPATKPQDLRDVLGILRAHPRHVFWTDHLDYSDVTLGGVIGHRQVTDAYLAELARAHAAKLVTFDRGLALAHADVSHCLTH